MNSPLRRLLCLSWYLLIWWPVAAGAEQASPSTRPLSPEAIADFEWFSDLGFPDVRGCLCARVATGEWSQSGTHPPENKFIDAFLLRHDDNTGRFTVLTPDLFTRDFVTTKPEKPAHERISYEEKPLAAEADAYLAALTRPPAEEDRGFRRFGERLPERSEVFAWAWACWRNGFDARAALLYQHAAGMSSRVDRDNDGNQEKSAALRNALERDLGYAMIWRATLDFGDPKISRATLLDTFERVARNYPKSRYAVSAHETADRLRAMVAEDRAHAAKPAIPWADLSPDDRAAELIFRLRDQNGQQWSQPGSCDIFGDFGGAVEADPHKEKSPAAQLVDLGYAAVPRLIAALDDHNFSRSVGYHRNFYFSHHVLTIGDCAEQTLQRIAGRSFYTAKTTSSYMSRDDETAGVKKAVETWWQEFEKKGEKQTLIDAVSQGGQNGAQQADRLCERYPDAALASLIQGAQNTTNGWARLQLVTLVGKQPGDGTLSFLEEELRTGPLLGGRLAAAQALWQHGRGEEAMAAMIDEWKHPRPPRLPGKPLQAGSVMNEATMNDDMAYENAKSWDEQSRGELVGFLAGCGRVDAVEALGHELRPRPVGTRLDVVSAFDVSRSNFSGLSSGSGGTGNISANHDLRRLGADEETKVNAAVEALLAAELDDREQRLGMSGTRNGKNFSDPRVCDLAGEVLHDRFKDKYTFDLGASVKVREKQRFACLNVWRGEHGEPLLPLPPERHVEPALEATIQPLLHTLATSDQEEEHASALAVIAKLGLPALGPLRAYRLALPAGDAARDRLENLERELACTVAEVALENVPDGAAEWRRTAQERLDTLKGQPLTSLAFVALAADTAGEIPAGVSGFELSAARDEDLAGVQIVLKFLTNRENDPGISSNVMHEHVTLGSDSLHSSSGSGAMESRRKTESYRDFARAADRALGAVADQPFTLMVSSNGR